MARCTVELLMKHKGLQGVRRGKPFIKTGIAHPMLAAQFGYCNPALGLFKNLEYPAFRITWLSHATLLKKKILPLNAAIFWGITVPAVLPFRVCVVLSAHV